VSRNRLLLALVCLVATVPLRAGSASTHVEFVAAGRDGRKLSCEQFGNLQRNGHNDRGWNDALLSSGSLRVLSMSPIECRDGVLRVVVSRPGTTLSLAWPSRAGYSMLLLDLTTAPRRFEDAVALQAIRELRATRSHLGLTATLSPATQRLFDAHRRATSAARARLAWMLWDDAVDETIRTLTTSGALRSPSEAVRRGVTFNSLAVTDQRWLDASAIVGHGGWVRVLLDLDEPIAEYRPIVERAHRNGLRVLGQMLDSSQMKRLDLAGWKTRVDALLDAYPDMDGWEVGNEVNGNWLGPDVREKVAYAAARAKIVSPQARTMMTVLWNLGEDVPEDSTFTWLATVPTSTLANIDDLGVSLYPEDHPLGIAFDRVFTTLHTTAPHAAIVVSELGYGNDDLGHTWWWGSPTAATSARRSVARFYDAASRAHPYSGGGTFWWYFLEEGDVR
jgi:hypothetical protein